MSVKPFILIAKQRSGSTWLADMINNHPKVKMYGELFLWRKRNADIRLDEFPGYYEVASELGLVRRQMEVFRYLNDFYSQGAEAAGFKLMYSHIHQFPLLLLYLRLHKTPVLHLVRCNYLDSILSLEIAYARKQFHSDRSGVSVAAKNGVRLDPQKTLKRIKSLEYQDKFVRKALQLFGINTYHFSYEELCEKTEVIMASIYHFLRLEIPPDLAHSRFHKLITKKHWQTIQNYDEIRSLLERTRYANLLKT